MSLYLYLPFGHIFVRKNSKILHQYMNRECFPEEGFDIERLNPDTKEKEYLLLSGKEGKDVVDFTWEGKGYNITSLMTVVVKKNHNDIWNVCTPTLQRKQGYLAALLEKYWEWAPNVTTRLYVVVDNTHLLTMYQKFGFKVIKQSPSVYTMERKFKNQRSTRKTTTSWKTKSRKR